MTHRERILRVALVNSVNGEETKLKEVLPLVKQYGAAVVGLTMDDGGIPREAGRRLEFARKIVEAAIGSGIPKEDVVIDPLAMSISTDHLSALETLKAIRLIREELGVNQTLGASNISFGLPKRQAINGIVESTPPVIQCRPPEAAFPSISCASRVRQIPLTASFGE